MSPRFPSVRASRFAHGVQSGWDTCALGSVGFRVVAAAGDTEGCRLGAAQEPENTGCWVRRITRSCRPVSASTRDSPWRREWSRISHRNTRSFVLPVRIAATKNPSEPRNPNEKPNSAHQGRTRRARKKSPVLRSRHAARRPPRRQPRCVCRSGVSRPRRRRRSY